jgi:hypothetical protein
MIDTMKQKIADSGLKADKYPDFMQQDMNIDSYPQFMLEQLVAECQLKFGLSYKDNTYEEIKEKQPELLTLHNNKFLDKNI